MNYQASNGNIVWLRETEIVINGVKYPLPKKCKGNTITQINDKIYVNGYEFKDGKFKRTLKALWHYLF